MSTQHTPGPWKFGSKAKSNFYKRNIAGADGYHVAAVSSRDDHEVDANARLISAAPELLEALKVARHMIIEDGTPIGWSVGRIDEVIAKATGAA
jgi:hypothetical protein